MLISVCTIIDLYGSMVQFYLVAIEWFTNMTIFCCRDELMDLMISFGTGRVTSMALETWTTTFGSGWTIYTNWQSSVTQSSELTSTTGKANHDFLNSALRGLLTNQMGTEWGRVFIVVMGETHFIPNDTVTKCKACDFQLTIEIMTLTLSETAQLHSTLVGGLITVSLATLTVFGTAIALI